MKHLSLKVLTITAVLGVSPLLLSAQQQSGAAKTQLDPIVKQGTAHLDLDDATRAQYRYHKGHWWFRTKKGPWLIHQDGSWKPADPKIFRQTALSSKPQMDPVPDPGVSRGSRAGDRAYYDQFIPENGSWGYDGPVGTAYFDQFIPANGSWGYDGPVGTAYFDQFIPANGSWGYDGPVGTAYFDQFIPEYAR